MTTDGWLDRYLAGDRDRVWHDLRQLGGHVREPDVVDEVQAVCDEMARRARHNVETVVARLREQGYRFHTNDEQRAPVEPFVPATGAAAALVPWLESTFGVLPMAVASWIRLVGDVWLVGTHPRWAESSAADPLVIELEYSRYPDGSAREFYLGELDAWRDETAHDPDAGAFALPVAPDRLTKGDVSGGGPYAVPVPDAGAEGVFVAGTPVPFVTYLNAVFRHGGFPALTNTPEESQVRRSLAAGLLGL